VVGWLQLVPINYDYVNNGLSVYLSVWHSLSYSQFVLNFVNCCMIRKIIVGNGLRERHWSKLFLVWENRATSTRGLEGRFFQTFRPVWRVVTTRLRLVSKSTGTPSLHWYSLLLVAALRTKQKNARENAAHFCFRLGRRDASNDGG